MSFKPVCFAAFAAAVVLVLPTTVSADTGAAEYRRSMAGLVRSADLWNRDLSQSLSAIAVKPEQACGDDFAMLVQQGVWIADDLRGSAQAAPTALQNANVRAADGFDRMLAGAELVQTSCTGGTLAAATDEVREGRGTYEQGIRRIVNFISGFGRGR